MTLRESLKIIPNCKYYVDGKCEWASSKTGRIYPVSTAFCQTTCKSVGPYCDKNTKDFSEYNFLKLCWKRMPPDNGEQLAIKVINKYKFPVNIKIPDEFTEIRKQLNFLYEIPGFKSILLTGSMIVDTAEKKPLKDIDVILWFDSLKSYIDGNIQNKLPTKILNVTTDYFFRLGDYPDVYFSSLDVENKKFYPSSWLDIKINSIPDGVEIVRRESKFKDMLLELLYEYRHEITSSKMNWINVKKSWEMAESFLTSINSRGFIASTLDYYDIHNTLGKTVDENTYNVRRKSCFGDDSTKPCHMLEKDLNGQYSCGGCGCGSNKLAKLNGNNDNSYTKLHYPYLECPLKKPGFSNEAKS